MSKISWSLVNSGTLPGCIYLQGVEIEHPVNAFKNVISWHRNLHYGIAYTISDFLERPTSQTGIQTSAL